MTKLLILGAGEYGQLVKELASEYSDIVTYNYNSLPISFWKDTGSVY